MSAYATRHRDHSARRLTQEPVPALTDRRSAVETVRTGIAAAPNEAGTLIDAVIDRLADHLVTAVLARLGPDEDHKDEWLDSREAAEYLGFHRDTVRRLAAAHAIPAEQDGRGCRLFFRRSARLMSGGNQEADLDRLLWPRRLEE
jgi:excisionase family DNA binding protein